MTTFQAIIFGVVTGFSEFLPISPGTHQKIVPFVLNWNEPQGPALGALALGALLAVLIYFRHDWASIFSSLLQVILFRKKPMTLDERLPFFLIITTLPTAAGSYYIREHLNLEAPGLWVILAVFAAATFPLVFLDSFGRRNRGMFDWNWLDSLLIGIGQAWALVPGGGRPEGAFMAAMFRNYNREAAAKFVFYASAPLLAAMAFTRLRGLNFHAAPMPDLSWLSFCVAVLVSCFSGLLAIGGFMKHIERGTLKQYAVYRWILALVVAGIYWQRSRG